MVIVGLLAAYVPIATASPTHASDPRPEANSGVWARAAPSTAGVVAGTLVLTNGTYLGGDYDATWANVGSPVATGWDPVANEIWTSGDVIFTAGLGTSGAVAVYNASAGAFADPLLLGGGSTGSPVLPTAFVFDARQAEMDVIDEGVAAVRVLTAASQPAHTQVASIHVGGTPSDAAIDGKSGRLWVVDALSNRIDVVNTSAGTYSTISTPAPSSILYDAPAGQMFVGGYSGLTVFNATTGSQVTTLPLPALGLAVDPSTANVFLSSGGRNVSVVGAPADHLVTNVTLPPSSSTGAIAYDSAAQSVLVSDGAASVVWEIAAANESILRFAPVGPGARAVAVDDTSGRVYVGCFYSNNLTVLRADTLLPVGSIRVGALPSAVLPDPGSGDLLLPDALDLGVWVVQPSPTPTVVGFLDRPFGNSLSLLGSSTGVAWDPQIGRTLLALRGASNLSILGGVPPSITGSLPTPFSPNDVAYDAANASLAVAGPTSVAFLNATTGALLANVTLPAAVGLAWCEQVRFDPVTGSVDALVGSQFGVAGTIYQLSGATHAILRNVTVGQGATSLTLDSAGSRLWVGEVLSGNVTVLDSTNLGVVHEMPVPGLFSGRGSPSSTAVSASHHAIYVADWSTNAVLVYDSTSYALKSSYDTPSAPLGLEYNASTDTVYAASADSASLHRFTNLGGPIITSFMVSPGTVGVGNLTTIFVSASGGVTPYSYTYTMLPTGCISANLSSLDCYPSAPGSYSVTVEVRDVNQASVTASRTLTVTGSSSGPAYRVTFAVTPPTCPALLVNGVPRSDGTSANYLASDYPVRVSACSGYPSFVLIGSGNVSANSTVMTVRGNGTVALTYLSANEFVVAILVTPIGCGAAVSVAGRSYGPNSTAVLGGGNFEVVAGPCAGFQFSSWETSGKVGISAGTLNVTGNGSLRADYTSASAPRTTSRPFAGLSSTELVLLGAIVAATVAGAALFLIRRRRSGSSPPGKATEAPEPEDAPAEASRSETD
ncbi:MAG: hypothetical protein L3K13_02825 [Thermoplasmata archaeon]|nr:hypothetical protein [Thermoplasmata archaeon]